MLIGDLHSNANNHSLSSLSPWISIAPQETTALDGMIDSLLSKGCISQAHRLASQFGHAHRDLSITLTCLQLMQGRLAPQDVDSQLRFLFHVFVCVLLVIDRVCLHNFKEYQGWYSINDDVAHHLSNVLEFIHGRHWGNLSKVGEFCTCLLNMAAGPRAI